MKTVVIATMLVLGIPAAASAMELPLNAAVVHGAPTDGLPLTSVAWIGRYGQICRPGPVWLPACHASDRPGPYIPGHWNPMQTRWIPGHYS